MTRVGDAVYQLAYIIAGVAIGCASIIVIVQVFVRYFLGFSFSWGDELTRYFMIWGTFVGASCAFRKAMLAGITIGINKLPPEVRSVVGIITNLIGLVFLLIVIYFAMKQIFSPFVLMQKSPAMRLPMYIPYFSIPFGFTLMVFFVLEQIIGGVLQLGGRRQ
ncbi:MAG: TRAP transporter small permease [Bacillota bacterium]